MTDDRDLRRRAQEAGLSAAWMTDECAPSIQAIECMEKQTRRLAMAAVLLGLSPWIVAGLLVAVALGRCS